MAQTKTVLKLDIACQKCKTKVLKAVTAIEGVDKVETDEAKGTLAVTGTADPFEIVKRTRKAIACAGKIADVVSIGPPPKPGEKKPDEKKRATRNRRIQRNRSRLLAHVHPTTARPIMDRPMSSYLVKLILLALFFNRIPTINYYLRLLKNN
uniref:HMA domain-containing protein n=1 Tax=Cucumis melo TaxID=3656 RepID=A0A9I9CSY0_CUCME